MPLLHSEDCIEASKESLLEILVFFQQLATDLAAVHFHLTQGDVDFPWRIPRIGNTDVQAPEANPSKSKIRWNE